MWVYRKYKKRNGTIEYHIGYYVRQNVKGDIVDVWHGQDKSDNREGAEEMVNYLNGKQRNIY